MRFLAFFIDLVEILAAVINWWKRETAKEVGRQEVREQQAHADDAARTTATSVRDRVGRMSDHELDDGLRQFARPS